MTRTGTYRALYLFAVAADAYAFAKQLQEGVVASFGEGDDQWEGLDVCDAGATITVHTREERDPTLRHGLISVEARIPIAYVPTDYWFSPTTDDNLMTVDEQGKSTHGEPVKWGLLRNASTLPTPGGKS